MKTWCTGLVDGGAMCHYSPLSLSSFLLWHWSNNPSPKSENDRRLCCTQRLRVKTCTLHAIKNVANRMVNNGMNFKNVQLRQFLVHEPQC